VAFFLDYEWCNSDEQVDQHAGNFHYGSFATILQILETRLDKTVGDMDCHDAAFLVSVNGSGDKNAFCGGSRTGGFLFGEAGSGFGTLIDATAFDCAVTLFAKWHHCGLRFLLFMCTSSDTSIGVKHLRWRS